MYIHLHVFINSMRLCVSFGKVFRALFILQQCKVGKSYFGY